MQNLRDMARRRPLALGYFLIFLFTWPVDLAMAAQSQGRLPFDVPEALGLFVGYGFVLAAIIAAAIVGGLQEIGSLLRRYLIWRVGLAWYAIVLLLPPAVTLAAIGVDWLAGGMTPDFSQPFVRKLLPDELSLWVIAPFWLVFEMLTNGEEIGWRGYILPRLLDRHNALVASLILWPVWAIWHVPKFLLAGTVGSAHAYPFWIFALNILAFTILLTWVFVHTRGSLLLATLFHAVSNTAVLCLPAVPGERAFYIMVALHCLIALIIVLAAGPNLGEYSTYAKLAPSHGESYHTDHAKES